MDAGGRQSPPACLWSREVAVMKGAKTGSLGAQMGMLVPQSLCLFLPPTACPSLSPGSIQASKVMHPCQMCRGLPGNWLSPQPRINIWGKQCKTKMCIVLLMFIVVSTV